MIELELLEATKEYVTYKYVELGVITFLLLAMFYGAYKIIRCVLEKNE